MIYVVITLANLLIEIFVWWISRDGEIRGWVRRQSVAGVLTMVASNVRERVNRQESNTWPNSITSRLRGSFDALSKMSGKDKTAFFILRPMDIIGSIWLAYCVTAQTFGSYQNCECMASTWGIQGVSDLSVLATQKPIANPSFVLRDTWISKR